MAKPTCGSQGAPVDGSVGGVLDDLIALFGIVGAITSIIALTEKMTIVTILGVSAPAAIWLAAVAGAVAAGFVVFDFWRHRCLTSPDTLTTCTSGVVVNTVQSFSSSTDGFFPFAAMHDRVDVVVKSIYWPEVETNAGFVHCNNDVDSSPILRGYYKSAEVCAAGAGATIGAGVGLVPGILAGVAVAAAIGCATIIFCLLALLVAALIAAIIVIAAAIIGGHIGRAAAESTAPSASDGTPVLPAHYVTTKGGTLTSEFDDGARVYWFATETSLHGRSTAPVPNSFTDPDANLITDACSPRAQPPIG